MNAEKAQNRFRLIAIRMIPVIVLATAAVLIYLSPERLVAGGVMLAVLAILAVLVTVHARRTWYSCTGCSHRFQISAWIDFVSPHVPGAKYLKCPGCGKVGWQKAE
jgi:hypothetical protein